MILKFNKINRDMFLMIRNGQKTIETRAATKKYRDIKTGDQIIFVCGKEKFIKKVKIVRIYKSISSLIRKYKPIQIVPTIKTSKELEKVYLSFPNYKEKIKKYGLIALELK